MVGRLSSQCVARTAAYEDLLALWMEQFRLRAKLWHLHATWVLAREIQLSLLSKGPFMWKFLLLLWWFVSCVLSSFSEDIVSGTPLVVQWLRPHAPSAGGLDSNRGQGTRSRMSYLRVCMGQLEKKKSCIP